MAAPITVLAYGTDWDTTYNTSDIWKLMPPHGLEVEPFFTRFASLNLFPYYTRHEPRKTKFIVLSFMWWLILVKLDLL